MGEFEAEQEPNPCATKREKEHLWLAKDAAEVTPVHLLNSNLRMPKQVRYLNRAISTSLVFEGWRRPLRGTPSDPEPPANSLGEGVSKWRSTRARVPSDWGLSTTGASASNPCANRQTQGCVVPRSSGTGRRRGGMSIRFGSDYTPLRYA